MVDLGNMMKQVQQMQSDMKKIQEELNSEIITTGSGRGAVIVSMNGEMELKELTIDPKLAPMEDHQQLSDMIKSAVNEALEKAKTTAAKKMSRVAGGLNIPGLSGLLGK
jgi:hypothetical protein